MLFLLFFQAEDGIRHYDVTGVQTCALPISREAAIAKSNGDTEAAIEHLETAVEAMYDTITTVADVATDQSDRGLIAVLNEFAYRPLLAEFEKLLDAE